MNDEVPTLILAWAVSISVSAAVVACVVAFIMLLFGGHRRSDDP